MCEDKKYRVNKGEYITAGLFIFLPGLVFLIWGSYLYFYGFISGNRPAAAGEVIACNVNMRNINSKPKYFPEIACKYTVEDKSYTFKEELSGCSSEENAHIYLKKWPPGKKIKVFYNERNHSIACIFPVNYQRKSIEPLIGGSLMILLGVIIIRYKKEMFLVREKLSGLIYKN